MCDVIYITHESLSRQEHGSHPLKPQVERAQPLLVLWCDFLCDSRSRRLVRALEHRSNIRDVRERRFEIAVIDRVCECVEQSGEPRRVRRLVELRGKIEGLDLAVALEAQHAADPVDRAGVADESHVRLAMPCRPREEHDAQPLRVLEEQMRAVLYVVVAVAQQPRPCLLYTS